MEPGLRTYKQASLRVAVASGLPIDMHELTREILSVKSDAPREGHATALLYQTCAEADKWWMTLVIQVRPFDDGMTMEQLQKFYTRFGFLKIQDEPVLMARSPQLPNNPRMH